MDHPNVPGEPIWATECTFSEIEHPHVQHVQGLLVVREGTERQDFRYRE